MIPKITIYNIFDSRPFAVNRFTHSRQNSFLGDRIYLVVDRIKSIVDNNFSIIDRIHSLVDRIHLARIARMPV
jgi:hypothetical protein